MNEEIEIQGHKFRAIAAREPGKCGPCVFKEGFGCRLAEAKGEALSYCSGKFRADGTDVYYAPAHMVNHP